MAQSLRVFVTGDATKFSKTLKDVDQETDRAFGKIGATLEGIGDKLGVFNSRAGDAFSSVGGKANQVGDNFKGMGGVAAAGATAAGAAVAGLAVGVGVAAVKIGGYLLDVGGQYDDAVDAIRIGTGATGKQLDILEQDFKEVARNVPDDLGTVGAAMSELSQRTGLTGQGLQVLAEQTLNLSRITGTDLTTNIETVTRVFGDWGIEVADMAPKMDVLFRASQASGVAVDQLGAKLVQFGAPLRQLGFTFEESTAMIARFEREGVNTELVLGSMRIALGKMAKEGEPAIETFRRVTDQIKNAGSTAEANKLALELFGSRAGPDMAAAIREGRFELDSYLDVISGGTDTINSAADETAGWSEKWDQLKNQLAVEVGPAMAEVLDQFGNIAEEHGPAFAAFVRDTLVPAISEFAVLVEEEVIPALRDFGAWWSDNDVIAKAQAMFHAIAAVYEGTRGTLALMRGDVVAAVGHFAAAKDHMVESWSAMQAKTEETTTAIGGSTLVMGQSVTDTIASTMTRAQGTWSPGWSALETAVANANGGITVKTQEMGTQVTTILGQAIERAQGTWPPGWSLLDQAVANAKASITGNTQQMGGQVTSALQTAMDTSKSLWGAGLDTMKGQTSSASGAIQTSMGTMKTNVISDTQAAIAGSKSAWGPGMDSLKSTAGSTTGSINTSFQGMKTSVPASAGAAASDAGNRWAPIRGALINPVATVASMALGSAGGLLPTVINTIARLLGLSLSLPSLNVREFHSGGTVGEKGGAARDLGRTPMRADEVLAVLRRGEMVVPAGDRFAVAEARSDAYVPMGDGPGLVDRLKSLAWDVIDKARQMLANTVRPAVEAMLGSVRGMGGDQAGARIARGAGSRTLEGALDWVLNLGKELGKLIPPLGEGIGWQAMWGALKGAFPTASLFSAFRPNAITSSGNPSYHSMGRAIDVSPWMSIFDWVARNYGSRSREVIFSPAGGRQVRNGGAHMYTGQVRADHWDHVHWAMDQGGVLPPGPSLVTNNLGKPEPLARTDQLGPKLDELIALIKGGALAQIHVHDRSGDPVEVARAARLQYRLARTG